MGPALRGASGSMDTGTIRATEDEALQFHANGRPGKLSIAPTKPLTTQRDLSLAYSPGVAFPCLHIQRQPERRLRLHLQGQFRRGDLQRHRGAGARRSRRARGEAGDGGQGGAVQALRRHRCDRSRDRHPRRRRVRQLRALSASRLRRHQSRGHQGAGMLHHRAAPARAPGHPGVPRRSARHRDHRRGRADQRARPDRARAQARSRWWSTAPAPPRSPASSC